MKWTSCGNSGRGYSKASTDGCRNSQSPARGRTGKTGQPCWAASLRYARLTRPKIVIDQTEHSSVAQPAQRTVGW